MKLSCNLTVLVVTQIYKCVKIHKPEHQKKEKVNFTIWPFFFLILKCSSKEVNYALIISIFLNQGQINNLPFTFAQLQGDK